MKKDISGAVVILCLFALFIAVGAPSLTAFFSVAIPVFIVIAIALPIHILARLDDEPGTNL